MTISYVGIDPGPAATGIVIRRGQEMRRHEVVVNPLWPKDPKQGLGDMDPYLETVAQLVDALQSWAMRDHQGSDRLVTAMEGVIVPRGFPDRGGRRRFVHPRDILGLGIAYGHARGSFPDADVVQPNHHGYGCLANYPADLVTPGELRNGLNREAPQNSLLRHARSAWDVTLSAERQAAQLALI